MAKKRTYKRASDGKFAKDGSSSSGKTKKTKKKEKRLTKKQIRSRASKVVKNSEGNRKLSVAGGKSVSVFVGGSKRSTGRLYKKKKSKKKDKKK